ncbi:MAG: adenylyl-sulfate kinase [Proteobacteria bacterium]|nr:adenylyl-sulfate kinase [Pseudomonadota bacterium]
MTDNIVWHMSSVTRRRRVSRNNHRSVALWFTGLSGAGKSTLANAVEEQLHGFDCRTFVLDGDNVRHGLCGDLGFTVADRAENIRRIAEVSKLFVDAGMIVMAAFISPFRKDREIARKILGLDFIEIYCKCSLSMCEKRDVKGMYAKARHGEIHNFTGISSPYEVPEQPDLVINTGEMSIASCAAEIISLLMERQVIGGVDFSARAHGANF